MLLSSLLNLLVLRVKRPVVFFEVVLRLIKIAFFLVLRFANFRLGVNLKICFRYFGLDGCEK